MRLELSDAAARLGALVMLALVAGCGTNPVGPTTPEEVAYADVLGVDLAQMTMTESGLYYQVLEEGEGEAVAERDDGLTAEYQAWLSTGRLIDSSDFSGLLTLTLGEGRLIAGFEEGVQGMRLNETRLLVIPYWLAYGSTKYGIVPAYSTVVFRVTLVDLLKAGA